MGPIAVGRHRCGVARELEPGTIYQFVGQPAFLVLACATVEVRSAAAVVAILRLRAAKVSTGDAESGMGEASATRDVQGHVMCRTQVLPACACVLEPRTLHAAYTIQHGRAGADVGWTLKDQLKQGSPIAGRAAAGDGRCGNRYNSAIHTRLLSSGFRVSSSHGDQKSRTEAREHHQLTDGWSLTERGR
jgi:hypothetical protein